MPAGPAKSNLSPKARFISKNALPVARVPVEASAVDPKAAQRVLPEQKRKVLEDLLNREKVKANIDKLKDILTQKLIVKYGRCVLAMVVTQGRLSPSQPRRPLLSALCSLPLPSLY